MRVGDTLLLEHLSLLRNVYLRIPVTRKYPFHKPLVLDTGFRNPAKKQFEHALLHYKNDGTPYDFNALRCNAVDVMRRET